RTGVPWGVLALAFGVVSVVRETRSGGEFVLNDTIMGLGTACLLVFCQLGDREGLPAGRPPLLRLLNTRWAATLGAFPSSLSVVNSLLLSAARLLVRRWVEDPDGRLAVSMLVAAPLTVGFAYGFSLAFERTPGLPLPVWAAGRLGRRRHPAHRAVG